MKNYDHKKIEKKWQGVWEKSKIYEAKTGGKKKSFYGLIEFPYPSGAGLHVGHIRSNTAMDIITRKRRMQGYNVLYPIGWDAFGLPTENYAIKMGIDPAKITKTNTDVFRKQLKSVGFGFDWSREINTTDPAYFKWTQWIFLQMFKKGLAYKKRTEINWCPSCKIGLANEEVVGGVCDRCESPVEKREKEQWMLAITKYADRLDKDLDKTKYLEKIKIQQRNWIGKSEGSEIEFKIKNPSPALPKGKSEIPGYCTTDKETWNLLQDRVLEMRKNPTKAEDKLWQILKKDKNFHFRRQHIINKFIADFVCLSHNLIIEVDGDIHDLQKEKDNERTKILEILGYKVIRFKNEEVVNNINNVLEVIQRNLKVLPFGEDLGGVKIFTTRADTLFGATYLVLAPEHELVTKLKSHITNIKEVEIYIKEVKNKPDIERIVDDKVKTGVELKGIKVINPANGEEIPLWIADYVLVTYGTGAIMAVPQHDMRDRDFAIKFNLPIVDVPLVDVKDITDKVGGKIVTKYKLRDWVFSRQRYWGEPIPIVHCDKCGYVPVPEKELPILLPKVKSYIPTDNGESPLATISKWVNTTCPTCGSKAKRETDTMPNWAGSSWYFLRYTDPKNKKEFASKKALKYWMKEGVDWYNGGMEHTTLHLLYSRFWHKFLYDLKLVPTSEPYMKRTSHGMILAEGGVKMSKSIGNTVDPKDIVNIYGADTLRIYEMFIGPFDQSVAWSTESIIGSRRFLDKVWRLESKVKGKITDEAIQTYLHKTIKKIEEDIESMSLNTAISSMMILVNEMEKAENIGVEDFKMFLKILAPFAPHITEEIWQKLNSERTKKSIHLSPWPKWDKKKIVDETITIGVQINGKVRTEITITKDMEENDVKLLILKDKKVLEWIGEGLVKRVIYVKGRIINIVV